MRATLSSTLFVAPTIIFAMTLLAFSALGNKLTPSTVFSALTIFNQLKVCFCSQPCVRCCLFPVVPTTCAAQQQRLDFSLALLELTNEPHRPLP